MKVSDVSLLGLADLEKVGVVRKAKFVLCSGPGGFKGDKEICTQ